MKGSYGVIHLTKDTAIKEFLLDADRDKIFYRELFYLSLLKYERNVSKIISADLPNKRIIMERYDGDLYGLSLDLDFKERVRIASRVIEQILPVIQKLHSLGIQHNDIRNKNIFYKGDNFYLGDFSLANVFSTWSPYFGNNLYSDMDECDNYSTDLWMFGICIWSFLSCSLFADISLSKKRYLDWYRIYPSMQIPEDMYKVLSGLLRYNGIEREPRCLNPGRDEFFLRVTTILGKSGISLMGYVISASFYDREEDNIFVEHPSGISGGDLINIISRIL